MLWRHDSLMRMILVKHHRSVHCSHVLGMLLMDACAHVLTSFAGNDPLPAQVLQASCGLGPPDHPHIVHLVVRDGRQRRLLVLHYIAACC